MDPTRDTSRPLTALFGGSFNPPHVVHALVCLYLLQTGATSVWLIPTYRHAFDKALAPFEDRLEMCRRMAEPLGDRVQILDLESRRPGPSYTIDTVSELKAAHPERDFAWVVGSDILPELPLWKDIDVLRRMVDFWVLDRGGYEGPGAGVVFPALSSTAIRAALARGEGADALVPAAVLTYIRQRGLYGPASA